MKDIFSWWNKFSVPTKARVIVTWWQIWVSDSAGNCRQTDCIVSDDSTKTKSSYILFNRLACLFTFFNNMHFYWMTETNKQRKKKKFSEMQSHRLSFSKHLHDGPPAKNSCELIMMIKICNRIKLCPYVRNTTQYHFNIFPPFFNKAYMQCIL